jgi:arylsulfatase A-like enzyme
MSNRIHTLVISALVLFVLLACMLANVEVPSFGAPTATQTLTATLTPTLPPTLTATATETPLPTFTPTPTALVSRVVILSIDGLRPDAISLAPMPNLMALMQSSAYSLSAQTVYPSVTLISHSSMLSGLCPAKHGVYWNDYLPNLGYAQGTDLFDIAHAAGLRTYAYVGKNKLVQVTEPTSLDGFNFINDRDTVIMDRLLETFPQDFGVLFIHFAMADGMGHAYGWLSSQQFSVLFRADEAIGQFLEELDARNLRNETLFIITADHGGHSSTHGSNSPEDMNIPWIAVGPGIQPKALTSLIQTTDTAATAAFALGLPLPAEWDGAPVYEAFGLPAERQTVQCER